MGNDERGVLRDPFSARAPLLPALLHVLPALLHVLPALPHVLPALPQAFAVRTAIRRAASATISPLSLAVEPSGISNVSSSPARVSYPGERPLRSKAMQWPESRAAVEVGRYRQRRARLPSRIRSARPPLGRPRAAPFGSTPGLGGRRLLFVRGVARMADRYHTQHGEGEGQGRSCTRASATHLRCYGPRSVVVQQGEGTHPCCHARERSGAARVTRPRLAHTTGRHPIAGHDASFRRNRSNAEREAQLDTERDNPRDHHEARKSASFLENRAARRNASTHAPENRSAPRKHRRLADAERVGALVRSKYPHLFSTALPFILF